MTRKLKSPDDLKRQFEGEAEEEEETEAISRTTTFHVDETIRGVHYVGDFHFQVPNLGDSIMIGRMKTVYLPDGSAADQSAALLVEQICYLTVCLQGDKPNWWKPLEFMEGDLVAQLYNKGVAYANRFLGRNSISKADESGTGEEDRGGSDDSLEGHVGEDVQSPNERSKTVIHDTARSK